MSKHVANPYGAELDDQIVETAHVRTRHQHHDAVESIALLDVFGVIERLEELPNLGHAGFEILAPAKVDQQKVHIRRPKGVRRAQGIPDRQHLDLVATRSKDGVDLRPQALGPGRRAHVID